MYFQHGRSLEAGIGLASMSVTSLSEGELILHLLCPAFLGLLLTSTMVQVFVDMKHWFHCALTTELRLNSCNTKGPKNVHYCLHWRRSA